MRKNWETEIKKYVPESQLHKVEHERDEAYRALGELMNWIPDWKDFWERRGVEMNKKVEDE